MISPPIAVQIKTAAKTARRQFLVGVGADSESQEGKRLMSRMIPIGMVSYFTELRMLLLFKRKVQEGQTERCFAALGAESRSDQAQCKRRLNSTFESVAVL